MGLLSGPAGHPTYRPLYVCYWVLHEVFLPLQSILLYLPHYLLNLLQNLLPRVVVLEYLIHAILFGRGLGLRKPPLHVVQQILGFSLGYDFPLKKLFYFGGSRISIGFVAGAGTRPVHSL